MEQIIEYIKQTYRPLSIILYGSYANGTNNLNSDFDALIISVDHERFHDTSFVNGVQLDVFVYPSTFFEGDYDCDEFIQIFDGKIIIDSEGKGAAVKERVLSYLQSRSTKTEEEVRENIDWCMKMLERTKRHDTEGMFRWHWLLVDSLEIFCDAMKHPYFGPKKTLKWMEMNCPDAFAYYKNALIEFSAESLDMWITYLRSINKD